MSTSISVNPFALVRPGCDDRMVLEIMVLVAINIPTTIPFEPVNGLERASCAVEPPRPYLKCRRPVLCFRGCHGAFAGTPLFFDLGSMVCRCQSATHRQRSKLDAAIRLFQRRCSS